MISYIEDPKDSTKKTVATDMNSIKLQDIKSIYRNQFDFYTLITRYLKMK